VLRFFLRGAGRALDLDEGALAVIGELRGIEATRAPEAEVSGRVRVSYVTSDGSYEAGAVEAIFPDEVSRAVSGTELPLVLLRSEAQAIAERWLAEARVARDAVRFALPPSAAPGAGDRVRVGGLEYRLDRVEDAGARLVEAVRVEPAIAIPSDEAEETVPARPFVAPVPVFPRFLDLPLMRGDEVPHAPHLAVVAAPWPGSVAAWAAPGDAGYTLNRLIAAPAMLGTTLTALPAARPGQWDRGPALRVRLVSGTLSSADPAAVLAGENLLAIGDGSSDRWELLQFTDAELVGPKTWDLRLRLRGQAGTDAVMPEAWPAGMLVVRITPALRQIDLAPADRGLARNYRIGVAARGPSDPNVVHLVEAFRGVGLRPYAPAHLQAERGPGGDVTVGWVRRTRIDGDRWDGVDVPLGEESESYLVRVATGATVRREAIVAGPAWVYPAGMQAADGVTGPFAVEVAQISATFGPGGVARAEVAG